MIMERSKTRDHGSAHATTTSKCRPRMKASSFQFPTVISVSGLDAKMSRSSSPNASTPSSRAVTAVTLS